MKLIRLVVASAALEFNLLRHQWAFVILNIFAAISFIVMVSLFGLTGSNAPVAVLNQDHGQDGALLTDAMTKAFNSFSIKNMNAEEADLALNTGRLAGIIKIPQEFSEDVEKGATIPIYVNVDNVNVDMTEDIQRALPAAIVQFARQKNFPGIRVKMMEHDVLPKDTGYIAYLVVSALALDCMIIAGILGALATAGEWERKTIKFLRLSPASPGVVLAGKLLVSAGLSAIALAAAVLTIVGVYKILPVAPFATAYSLLGCVLIFTCIGAWLGVLFKRTMVAVPLIFGLVMPFYICSGALEPVRFDGQSIWLMAHASPVYYVVGILEWAFHGLHVTPEPIYVDFLILLAMALLAVALTYRNLSKARIR